MNLPLTNEPSFANSHGKALHKSTSRKASSNRHAKISHAILHGLLPWCHDRSQPADVGDVTNIEFRSLSIDGAYKHQLPVRKLQP